MTTSDDRRQDKRLDKVFTVYISGAWGAAFGIARNISEGGMFIEMTAVGEVVHLCFLNRTAAGGRREVMVGMGVRFLNFLEKEESQYIPATLVMQ